jgi:type IV secretion system protein VirB2
MSVAISMPQTSLTDAPPASAITAAATWVSDLLLGPLATVIGVVAIAWIGFAMLTGRVNVRRGLSAVLGCFILFGARGIVQGLQLTANDSAPTTTAVAPPVYERSVPAQGAPNGYDPYAGASVVRPGG